MSTARRIAEVARRHREENEAHALEAGAWALTGRVRDERFRCVEWCKRTGVRCRNPSVKGTDLCRKHGGSSIFVQVKYGRVQLEEAVTRHLEWLASHDRSYDHRPR